MLSILSVKGLRLAKCDTEWKIATDDLQFQLGTKKFNEVIQSVEYQTLFEANLALFDGVEKVRHGNGMSAKDFDDLNQARHRAKQALQKRFWNNELTEVKT